MRTFSFKSMIGRSARKSASSKKQQHQAHHRNRRPSTELATVSKTLTRTSSDVNWGMRVLHHPLGLEVELVVAGSPAADSCLAPGDIITAIDGSSVATIATATATPRMRNTARIRELEQSLALAVRLQVAGDGVGQMARRRTSMQMRTPVANGRASFCMVDEDFAEAVKTLTTKAASAMATTSGHDAGAMKSAFPSNRRGSVDYGRPHVLGDTSLSSTVVAF